MVCVAHHLSCFVLQRRGLPCSATHLNAKGVDSREHWRNSDDRAQDVSFPFHADQTWKQPISVPCRPPPNESTRSPRAGMALQDRFSYPSPSPLTPDNIPCRYDVT